MTAYSGVVKHWQKNPEERVGVVAVADIAVAEDNVVVVLMGSVVVSGVVKHWQRNPEESFDVGEDIVVEKVEDTERHIVVDSLDLVVDSFACFFCSQ